MNETVLMTPVTPPTDFDALYRTESRRVLATLIRLLGDFERAEEALHDAFRAAMEQWPTEGVPDNPRAWLVSTGRFKAIDRLRRDARFDALDDEAAGNIAAPSEPEAENIEDDRLRLIFTCCHPALNADAQAALTLREVCGLTTEEIARAYLTPAPTIAQRIVRAKAKIRDAKIPYQVPTPEEFPGRLESVLRVIYLVYNEGYAATAGETLARLDLSSEAIRLMRLLKTLLPQPQSAGEIKGLLALMLLNESRRAARVTAAGDVILLEDQDRSLWNHDYIQEGLALTRDVFESRQIGPYAVQAAISAMHAQAASAADTDWVEIVGLYDLLLTISPSPVVALNRAVAVAMRDGPEAGLALVDALMGGGELTDYRLVHAARADLCRRLGRTDEARLAYQRALALTQLAPEQRFFERRLAALEA